MQKIEELKGLISGIKERPGMYLSCFSVFTVKAFLDGWLRHAGSQNEGHSLMYQFQQFVIRKYTQNPILSWDKILSLYSQSEKDAMDLFFSTFEEFLNTVANFSDMSTDNALGFSR